MAIKFITGNKTKLKEFQEVMAPFEIEQLDIDLDEIQSLDPHEIIRHKLQEAFKHHSGEFIVEDSSMYMDALGGKLPGPLIKWFFDGTFGIEGLAELAAKMGNPKGRAKTIIGYAKGPDDIMFFEGDVEGSIVMPRGTYHFGYDPILVPDGQERTLSEIKASGDFTQSPRGKAIQQFKEYLAQQEHE